MFRFNKGLCSCLTSVMSSYSLLSHRILHFEQFLSSPFPHSTFTILQSPAPSRAYTPQRLQRNARDSFPLVAIRCVYMCCLSDVPCDVLTMHWCEICSNAGRNTNSQSLPIAGPVCCYRTALIGGCTTSTSTRTSRSSTSSSSAAALP